MTYAPSQAPVSDSGLVPASVRAVVWLVVAQTVFSIVAGLPATYQSKDAILAQQGTTPGVDLDALWGTIFGISAVTVIGSGLLWVFFAVKLRQGRSWARITLLVLAIIGVVYTPFNLLKTAADAPVLLLTSGVGLAATIALLVLLTRESTKACTAQPRR